MNRKRNDRANGDASVPSSRRGFLATGLGQDAPSPQASTGDAKAEREILALSRQKWDWMSARKTEALDALFHEKAAFVHMGGTMSRKQEIDVIRSGGIHYKTVDIRDASARILGPTAIVLSTIRLVAVVGGNEVVNPFVVTEVYVRQGDAWKLAQLSFTRTLGE